MNNNPIGIIDSGVGGLSVWQELTRQLPQESFIYLADSKHCPYGNRSSEEIYELAKKLAHFLLEREVKLMVIACNTITVHSLERLRDEFPGIPTIGIVPVIKTAVEKSKTKRIGIFSTVATANSSYVKDLIQTFASGCDVTVKGTDALVPMIEKGEITGKRLNDILVRELAEFQEKKVDCIALGCSHFPFVRAAMQEILGADVLLLDSAGAVGRQTKRVLEKNQIAAANSFSVYRFFTTGDEKQFESVAGFLRGKQIRAEQAALL